MSRVRISIDAGYLGDIEVTQDDGVGTYDADAQRKMVDGLIVKVVAQARAALGIEAGASQ